MNKYFLPLLFFLFPIITHGAVLINEVAWMGTSVSANAEWMELINTGNSTLDLTGWHLVAASGSPSITLSGSIAGNGYFLLERTSDASVPTVAADQIYTGALTNSGTTLTLTDAAGTSIDQVVGGTNWVTIGGDNATKDTAQRTSTGWVTAPGTPRAATVSSPISGNGSEQTMSSSSSTPPTTTSGSSSYVAPPSSIVVDAIADQDGFVEVPIRLFATVKTKGGAPDPSAQVVWNFGDGSFSEGTVLTKTYEYPGTYLVMVEASDGSTITHDELTITVRPAQVQIISVTDKGVTIENSANQRLDLSGWDVSTDAGSFRIPRGTILLPKARVLFPSTITNLPLALSAALIYPNGNIAARYSLIAENRPPSPVRATTTVAALAVRATQPPSSLQSSHTTQKSQSVPSSKKSMPTITPPALKSLGTSSPTVQAQVSTASSVPIFRSPWAFSFLGILALAGGAFMIL